MEILGLGSVLIVLNFMGDFLIMEILEFYLDVFSKVGDRSGSNLYFK